MTRTSLYWILLIFLLDMTCNSNMSFASPVETPPWAWRKGSFGLSSTTEYFSSRANYDTVRGQFTQLPSDNSLTDFNTWLRARYAFWPKFSMYTGAGIGQVRAVDSVNEKTTNGLTQAYMGGHFTVWRQWLLMVAEVEAGLPLNSGGPLKDFNRTQSVPLIDDGVYYARAILHIRRDIKSIRFFGHIGVRIPTDGLAKNLLYGIYAESPIGEFLMAGGGVVGHETLLNDELTEYERTVTQNSANAGSARYRSFDPAGLSARGWLGFKPGKTVEIRAGFAQTITGQRSASGQTYTINVVFNSIPVARAGPKFTSGSDRISAPGNTGDFKLESEKSDPDVIAPENEFEPQRSDDLNETERLFN